MSQGRETMRLPNAATAWCSHRALSRRQSLLWCGACRALSYRWLAGWGHAPDGVRKVVGDDEGATRVHAHPDRPATSLSVRPSEEDRKSVVKGKSVSVRVDLGVGRIIKKKN